MCDRAGVKIVLKLSSALPIGESEIVLPGAYRTVRAFPAAHAVQGISRCKRVYGVPDDLYWLLSLAFYRCRYRNLARGSELPNKQAFI